MELLGGGLDHGDAGHTVNVNLAAKSSTVEELIDRLVSADSQ